jgi:hypothetical protein
VVLPATAGGFPAASPRQVSVRLARNNDLPYGFEQETGKERVLSRMGIRITEVCGVKVRPVAATES